MQAVRCDACGMKALVAASQCPHCGHLLDLRDSFGELLPLAHCPSCDCWYPRREGSCRWCGTAPEASRMAPLLWKGAGIVAFAGMAVGVFLTRDTAEEPARDTLLPRMEPVFATPVAGAAATGSQVATADTTRPPGADSAAIAASDTLGNRVEVAELASAALAGPPAAVESVTVPAPAPAAAERPAPVQVTPATPRAAVVPRAAVRGPATPVRNTRQQRRAVGWTSVVILSWSTVRSAPERGARILGSVGPDTHVQLGEVRGDWRRIRTAGLAGWVLDARFAPRRAVARRSRAQ